VKPVSKPKHHEKCRVREIENMGCSGNLEAKKLVSDTITALPVVN
jgi:hypothetical protein